MKLNFIIKDPFNGYDSLLYTATLIKIVSKLGVRPKLSSDTIRNIVLNYTTLMVDCEGNRLSGVVINELINVFNLIIKELSDSYSYIEVSRTNKDKYFNVLVHF